MDGEAAEDPSDCIPLQLQRLFGQLQLSDKTCVETRALTDSFGWTAQVSSLRSSDIGKEACLVGEGDAVVGLGVENGVGRLVAGALDAKGCMFQGSALGGGG